MTPTEHLEAALAQAAADLKRVAVASVETSTRIEKICRYPHNRTPTRMLLTCALAKLDKPSSDPRKPYTEIDTLDSFSGRDQYDEPVVGPFVTKHKLPCNPTTAFLTPAVRTKNRPFSVDVEIVGRPKWIYQDMIRILEDVAEGRETPVAVLTDALRVLLNLKQEREQELDKSKANLRGAAEILAPSSEDIVTLIDQHLKCKRSSRLPVLIVAAAYQTVSDKLGETIKPLTAHTAADEQTGASGDIEVTLVSDSKVCTVYEMKRRVVGRSDIERALQKVAGMPTPPDNYIFVTTERIDPPVHDYATSLYEESGVEFAVLDCLGFLRHFLHLFHRRRVDFLDKYQALVESDSAVGHELKIAFLALRAAAAQEPEPSS